MSCNSIQVESIRIVVFILMAVGLAMAGFFMFDAAQGIFVEKKNWRIETMTCK